MRKICPLGIFMLLASLLVSGAALADETMDRIKDSGKIRVGWRDGSIPFAYIDATTGKHVGFSVDITKLVVEKLSEHFGKTIEIEPYSVTSKTRIPMIVNREIDIEMGTTTHTQKRDEVVDFSLVFFFSETTFLVRSDSGIRNIGDLNGMKVGSSRGSSNLAVLLAKIADGAFSPNGRVLETENHPQGFAALESGEIDAYCTDRSLLEGMRMKSSSPNGWMTVPFAIAYEPYGYMVWEGNSDIRDFIDNTIIWAIKNGKYEELYEKWMGPDGVVPIPMSRAFKDYLKLISYPQSPDWWKQKNNKE